MKGVGYRRGGGVARDEPLYRSFVSMTDGLLGIGAWALDQSAHRAWKSCIYVSKNGRRCDIVCYTHRIESGLLSIRQVLFSYSFVKVAVLCCSLFLKAKPTGMLLALLLGRS